MAHLERAGIDVCALDSRDGCEGQQNGYHGPQRPDRHEIRDAELTLGEDGRAVGADRTFGRAAARRRGIGGLGLGRLGKLVPEHAPPPLIELAAASKVHFRRNLGRVCRATANPLVSIRPRDNSALPRVKLHKAKTDPPPAACAAMPAATLRVSQNRPRRSDDATDETRIEHDTII